ncbi:ABC transporter permease [Bacillus sp. JCM 19034]|uniref:ABC transporter permease n=1 Tax=Bacillus sp. JCM 19034 TaxID=1481928 RepID=UPI0007823137|nr:ABC transporter permease [Bacillus sp. JCM 19034]
MQFKDQLQYVKRNMSKNRLRLFMTVLATTMGCAFLIVLASVGFGLQESIIDEMTQHQIMNEVSIYGREEGDVGRSVEDADIAEIRQLENVQAVVTRNYIPYITELSLDSYSGAFSTQLTDFVEEEKSNLQLSRGRFQKRKTNYLSDFIHMNFYTIHQMMKLSF